MKQLIARLKDLKANVEAEDMWIPYQESQEEYRRELDNAAPQLFDRLEKLEAVISAAEMYINSRHQDLETTFEKLKEAVAAAKEETE